MDVFGEGRKRDREAIAQALQGQIDGQPASKEECSRLILELYDHAVVMAHGAIQSVRALDHIMKAHDVPVTLSEYLDAVRESASHMECPISRGAS